MTRDDLRRRLRSWRHAGPYYTTDDGTKTRLADEAADEIERQQASLRLALGVLDQIVESPTKVGALKTTYYEIAIVRKEADEAYFAVKEALER